MSKKVLIFSVAYHPFIGGAEIAVKEITNRIDDQDIEFDMITIRFDSTLPKYERIGNINVYRIGFATAKPSMTDLLKLPLVLNKFLFPLLGVIKARSLDKKRHYDIIWSIMASFAGYAAVLFKMQYAKKKLLLTLQEGDPIEHIKKRAGITYPLFKRIFTKANMVQAISTYLAEFAKSMGFQGKSVVVPNGVDVDRFSLPFSESERDEIRTKIGIEKYDTALITTSRLVPKNAVEDVIEAIAKLPKSVKFFIIGEGPEEIVLKELVESLELKKRVFFLGELPHGELPAYLQVADIFVRPSVSEGMGNSFVEAMAAKIPVIATPVGGIVDFLYDPEKNSEKKPTGLFCKVHDSESIASQVKRLIEDKKLYDTLIENAHKLVSEQYTWDRSADLMKTNIFGKLLHE